MVSLKLYIATYSPSTRAITSGLNRALEKVSSGDMFDLEVISVLEAPDRAMADNVMVTPTVIRSAPSPETRVTGNFSDITAVIQRLGLSAATAPDEPLAP